MPHTPVLLKESIDNLNLKPGQVLLDGTLGGGGHSAYAIQKYGVRVIGLDLDSDAEARARKAIGDDTKLSFYNIGFQDLDIVLAKEGITEVDGIILDLGVSSFQLDDADRGFSFRRDEPLLMTLQKEPTADDTTASDIVNSWGEENLADIIYGYGEEKYSRRIARAIVEARALGEIKTTFQLVSIIEGAVPAVYRRGRIHPATRTFQALRIATNNELGNIEHGLAKGFVALKPGGRMAVISFHSLEDRIVKRFFALKKEVAEATLVGKRPIVPTEEELRDNPRSRSSKLRILEKISTRDK